MKIFLKNIIGFQNCTVQLYTVQFLHKKEKGELFLSFQ